MSELFHDPKQDRPIGRSEHDVLDRGPFVKSLVRALVIDEVDASGRVTGRRATGYVVGLTGRWGLGKSSVLNLLGEKLGSMDRTIVARFNPWIFNGRDELLTGFFSALRTAVGKSNTDTARELAKQLDRYWGAINLAGHGVAAFVDLHGGLGAATSGWRTWFPRFRQAIVGQKVRSPDEERVELEKKLAKLKCAVVVLIDELDRIEDEEVRAVAQLVKAVGDIKGVSYLVAYDQERVIQALGRGHGGERRSSGENYLEKIIQHPIPLRPMFEEDASKLLTAGLLHHGVELPEFTNDSQKRTLRAIIREISTPREIKRLVGAYAILERAVRGEICPYDTLAYCWILTKSPLLRDLLASNIDKVVSDPGERELFDRAAQRQNGKLTDVGSVLGIAAKSQERLLKQLFPIFGWSAEGPDSDRLYRRRNLVRMLFLGDPPGMVPNREVQALWSSPTATIQNELKAMLSDGRITALIDRIDDLLPVLPPSGDRGFWTALANVLPRESDWLKGPEILRAVSDDAASALYRLGLRHPEQSQRVASCIDVLIEAGDLVLVPWLLRKLLYAHGLTNQERSGRGSGVLDSDKTSALLQIELVRYQAAVLDGTALRRVPNLEAIYVLANSGNWTSQIRESLTSQLVDGPAIFTLAGMVVPPGYATSKDHLDELFDAETVLGRLESLKTDDQWPSDPWMAESARRLYSILKGRDPNFDDDDG